MFLAPEIHSLPLAGFLPMLISVPIFHLTACSRFKTLFYSPQDNAKTKPNTEISPSPRDLTRSLLPILSSRRDWQPSDFPCPFSAALSYCLLSETFPDALPRTPLSPARVPRKHFTARCFVFTYSFTCLLCPSNVRKQTSGKPGLHKPRPTGPVNNSSQQFLSFSLSFPPQNCFFFFLLFHKPSAA